MSTIVISNLSVLEKLNNHEVKVFGAKPPASSSSISNSTQADDRARASSSSTGNNSRADDNLFNLDNFFNNLGPFFGDVII